jgi:alpha-ketoglutarate-dependent taurine dioxygenase
MRGDAAALTPSFGLLLRPSAELPDLAALHARAAELQERLRGAGALLLRGFGFDLAALESFSGALAPRFLPHRATAIGRRERVTETTATVNLGGRAFDWHRELGYAPFPPDLLFFLCERPARSGGETLLSDGCAIFETFGDKARALARSALVEYGYRLPRESWELALGARDEAGAHAALERLAARLRAPESLAWKLADDGLRVRYCAPMLVPDTSAGRPAFCNQVILRAHKLTLRGGEKIPAWFLREARAAAGASAYAVAWQPGDLALVDNARVMHARPEISDPARRILVRLAYLTA